MSLPTRILHPTALLRRLRPVTLETHTHKLRAAHRLHLGLALLHTLFPHEIEAKIGATAHLSPEAWWQLLGVLCALVQTHNWFPINWAVLDEAHAYLMQTDDDPHGDQLAAYLTYIPVGMYGFGADKIFEFPPMELLRALLSPQVEAVSSDLLVAAGLYDFLDHDWDEALRAAAWQHLDRIESDPGLYPEPVRFLPELARWACGRTGNPLLDQEFDPSDAGFSPDRASRAAPAGG